MRLGFLVCGLLLALALGSCSFDWDSYDPRLTPTTPAGPGGSGGGGQGGAGGGVGGSGGIPTQVAPDWSNSMLAVYTFEDPNNLGRDGSGNGLDLSMGAFDPATSFMDPEPRQGSLSLLVDYGPPQTGIESAAAEFETPPGTSITFGGWFKAASHPPSHGMDAMGKTGGAGFFLGRSVQNAALCGVNDGTWQPAPSPDDSWPLDTWVHVVCRYDDADKALTGFTDGTEALALIGLMGITAGTRTFGLPSAEPDYGFDGQMDDVFVVMSALSDEAIARIAACGIDGAKCLCNPDTPIAYLDCGEAQPSCASLAACDSAAP